MKALKIIKLYEHKELLEEAAKWFHEKWGISKEVYLKSMWQQDIVPQWYIIKEHDKIIAGAGVIENDFHVRKDLTPNVCALYVESAYRRQGIGKKLLHFICEDYHQKGISNLYLVTEHTTLYETYGWQFLCLSQEENSEHMTRVYVHKASKQFL